MKSDNNQLGHAMQSVKARVLALYLPQFHPIPENDEWWGKGFTEWTNVGKAKRYFPGHYQPRVPTDLGYYDLRVPETREAQANLAREYGIEGFVYWHYWFGNGKRLLERPFNEVLASGKPDFPFCLAWANESWRGFWHGMKTEEPLIEQKYPGEEDYIAHFKAVLPAFKDRRYIRCNGKPVFFIYKHDQLPDAAEFIRLWQKLAKENDLLGIYFVTHVQNIYSKEWCEKIIADAKAIGFDAVNMMNLQRGMTMPFWLKIIRKALLNRFVLRYHLIPDIRYYCKENLCSPFDDNEFVIPSVAPGWDHTPRTGNKGILLVGSTPEKFQKIAEEQVAKIQYKPFEERFLVVKSWNEWAEGNYLEPDLKYGHQYLQALRNAIVSRADENSTKAEA